jgi:DNA-binding NarL/FixJ family response regulator
LYKQARQDDSPFDVVIMDLTIPGGMGGKEALSKLLEIDPSVKAIVSSGYANDPIMSNFEQYGFAGVVPKPYKIEDLSTVLEKLAD